MSSTSEDGGSGGSSRAMYQSSTARSAISSSRSESASWRVSSVGTTPRSDSISAAIWPRSNAGADRSAPGTLQPRGGTGPAPAARAFSSASRISRSASAYCCWRGSGSATLEPHDQRAVVELRRRRLEAGERAREHDRALVAVDPHHQLEPDLAQRDVALADEREIEPQLGARAVERELLRQAVVQHRARVAAVEQRRAEAVEHRRAQHLLLEVGRAQYGHGGEAGLHVGQLLGLHLAPGAEVVADVLGEH